MIIPAKPIKLVAVWNKAQKKLGKIKLPQDEK